MKKVYLLLILLCTIPLCLLAQQRVISGKVTDSKDGTSVPGVSVFTLDGAGKRTGVTTNTRGEYQITLPAGATSLTFSFLGMQTITEQIGTRTTINVAMTSSEEQLQSVVVVGYGTKRKETLTGAVSNITAKDIQTTTNISLAQKLQGKVAGLQIRQLGGEPGTFDNMINIRGFGTPLFVIDGIARDGASEFQRLNPEDIESVSFLKDASAAIYGRRAANGVVIVTTKKGVSGQANFNYNGTVGFLKPTDVPRMANASEFMQMRNEADLNKPLGNVTPFITKDELQKWIDGTEPGYQSTDWYSETMKKSTMQQNHVISASGGTDKTQYFLSFGYADEMGLLKTNDMYYKRFNLRSNITTQLHKNLKAELLIGGLYDNRTVPGENFFNIFKGTRITLPTSPVYANNNPEYPQDVQPSNQNPVVLSNAGITGYAETVNRNIQTLAALTYTFPFVEGLSMRGTASYDLNNYAGKDVFKGYNVYEYINGEYVVKPQRVGSSAISNGFNVNNRVTLQLQANYSRTFAGVHNVGATLVYEQQQSWNRNAGLRRLYDFYTNDQVDNAGQANQTNNGLEQEFANLSYVGRMNYDYKNKYLIEFAFRQDGSYRYHPDRRWGFFPVVSGGWRLSEENFIKSNIPQISNLKLRGSYGIVAEDAGDPFQYIAGFSPGGGTYEFQNGQLSNGLSAPGIVNNYLTWLTANITDIGIEVGLWKNKFTFEFDVYQRDRKGLLAYRNVSLPNTFGGSLPQENLNTDRVKGFDFTVGYNGQSGDFKYGISGNFNFSRIMNLYVERGPWGSSWDKWKGGSEYRYNDVLFGLKYLGQFQSYDDIYNSSIQNGGDGNARELPGDFKYEDTNHDGVINGDDEVPMFIGANGTNDNQNPSGKNPKMNYGLTLNASWKGLDINLLFQGSAMYTVRFSEVYAEMLAFRGNTPAYFFDRWHRADPYDLNSEWIAGKWPAIRFNGDVGAMYANSSVWRKDASYVRLKSMELGYTIAPKLYSASGIKRIRVYANGFNLFTIADKFVKPFDPERLEGLFNAGFNYPLMKSFNFGVNVNF